MTSLVTIIIASPSQPFQGVPPPAKRLSCAIIAKSRRDDPTTPRYAMSGIHIRIGGFLYAAAIDARHRTCPRRHDMAA